MKPTLYLIGPLGNFRFMVLTSHCHSVFRALVAALGLFTAEAGFAGDPIPILPASVVEGAGILTNVGQVNLGSPASSNIVVTLQSSDTNSITLPASVTILSGQSNAFFNVTVGDNLIADGNRIVTVTAATDFSTNSCQILVIDNDPDHILISGVQPITDINTGFFVQLTALNADGSVQTNFNKSLTMVAAGVEGVLPLYSTNSGTFSQGIDYFNVVVTTPGHGIRVHSQEYPGQSDAFTVIPPAFSVVSQQVADMVWLAASQTLLASVPASSGAYSNCLVAIDPATGQVTNSYPIGYGPGEIEMSPDGNYLYVALSNATVLRRFDLNTRVAGLQYALGTNTNPVRIAYDFCVPSGLADSVVVEARDAGNGATLRAGIYRYDSGVAVPLPNLYSSGGWLLQSLDTASTVALSPTLVRGNAATDTILATAPSFQGTAVIYRGGQFFDDRGFSYSGGSLGQLGSYPNLLEQGYYKAVLEVDSNLRRVFYLEGNFNYGSSLYTLKVYDRDLFQPLFQMGMPSTGGVPTRLLRCGSNHLAYVTSNNQLWLIQPDATQPPGPAADVALSVTALPPIAVVGSNYTFSMVLSNAGPGVASIVRVTNALPANTTLVQTSPSSGTINRASAAFTWNVANLQAGSSATLQLTLQFNSGGWQTNTAWALGFEADPVFTNNVVTLPLYVQLPPQAYGAVSFNYPVQDILYDPVRDRLLLSVTTNTFGGTDGLAVFNPYTGQTESFVPLGNQPRRMARSDDGAFLYVSLTDVGKVRQLSLPTLTANYDFDVAVPPAPGATSPNYAADLAVVPGKPGSVVAWAVRIASGGSGEFGEGITLYQNGVMAPNITQTGGNWRVVFDTNSDELYAYNSYANVFYSNVGLLTTCALDSNGVTFTGSGMPLNSGGAEIKYAEGHLFTSAGLRVDENSLQTDWLFAGVPNAALVAADPAAGRVYFLVKPGNWQLNAYDIASHRYLGSITTSNLVGTPISLVRWGQDGLAFGTSSGQLYMVRWPLVNANAFADLAVSLNGPTSPASQGADITYTVTVTNQGIMQAKNILVTNTWSAGASFSSASSAAGNLTTNVNSRSLVWSLPSLDVNTQATLSFTVTSSQLGSVAVVSTAISGNFDPAPGNNTAVAVTPVGAPLALDQSLSLQLPLNDVAWVSSLGKFIVSSSSNTANWGGALLTVDPTSLSVQFQTNLGSDASRIAKSRDETLLYAGTDFGASAVVIPSFNVTNRFLINPQSPGAYAYDMKVAPNSNPWLAIGAKSPSNNSTWVAAFNSGVQLPNTSSFNSTALSLLFGDQASPLYAYTGSSFNRYTIDTNGVTVIDSTAGLLPTSTAMDLVWGNGLIYSSMGRVINPSNLTLLGTLAGIPAGSRVVFDSGSGWVFFLSPGGNQAVLRAFDGTTLLPAGSRTIPGISGSLSRFIRWGVDGFATITTSNQLAIFRSSLIPTNPPADVSVSLALGAPPYFSGSNITATIIVTNAGPNPATTVAWSNALPVGAVLLSASSSAGILATNANSVAGSIPLLPTGAAAIINVTFTAPGAGLATNQVMATASSVDPNFANNSAVALIWVQPITGLSNLVSLTLPVKDLERDPTRPRLYASLGSNAGPLANSVVAIDPINASIGTPVPVGSNPGGLAVSADGQFLYVALDGAGTVRKLSLPSLATVSSFAVPQSQTVTRMSVCPTNSDMVAIRRSPGGATSLHVGGVERPLELGLQNLFAFLDTTGQLFGCDGFHSNVKLYELDTSTNGLALLAGQPGKQSNASNIVSSGGLLFFNGGMVLDPATTRGVDLMPVPNNSVVAADAGCGRAFYLTSSNSAWTLRAFDIAQGIEVGTLSLPTLTSAPQKLLRWGADGLAYFNNSSQIVILRGQLVPTNPPVDVVLSQSLSTLTATTNDSITFLLQVTNLGPVTASGVVVTQSFSTVLTNVSLTTSVGVATYTNGVASWQVGALPPSTAGSLTVTGRATQAGTLTATAFASHSFNDLFWGNNAAIGAVNILTTSTTNTLMVRLSTRKLVYDPARDVIYASTPASNRFAGNLIAEIDPATGGMKGALAAGSEPDQVSLSDDDTYLHVALDGAMGVQRFNLRSNLADLSFGFSTNDIYYAQDLVVEPKHSRTVAASLASYNLAAPYPSTVIAYDDAVARPNSGGPSRGLDFSADGSTLFGYVSPGGGYAFESMALSPQGFNTVSKSGFTTGPGNLKYNNGRLYSASGQVVDANAAVLLGSVAASGLQVIDGNAGRAFYLMQSGTNWQIRAFDLVTLQSVGTQSVFNVQGTPSSLIRCGQDRLAFLTSASQLFIVHSALVATNLITPANLGVSQSVAQDFTVPVETLRFVITVSNRGPGAATGLLLAINPPSPVASVTLQLPQGTSTATGGNYLCSLGSLAAGKSLNVILSAVVTNTASYSNFVSVSAATPDPDLSDNTSSAFSQGLYFQRADSTLIYPSSPQALAYDFVRQRLFAALAPSGSTNLIEWYDPESGASLGTLSVDVAPDTMRITDNGQYLYLASHAAGLLERIDLSSVSSDLEFTPPQATKVWAMATIPGNPHSIALSYRTNISVPVTVIYDDAVARTNAVTDQPFGMLAASTDATALYGYANGGTGMPRVFRMSISGSGLQEMDFGPNDTPWYLTSIMKYASNRLFFGSGDVMDTPSWASEQIFALPGGAPNGDIELLPGNALAALLAPDPSSYNIAHFGIYVVSNRTELEQFDIRTSGGGFSGLTWCGADRFAFITTGGIVFVRSSFVPAADLSVSASFSTNQIMAGDTVTLQIVASNAGPYAVTDAFMTNTMPFGFSLASTALSQGFITTNGQTLIFALGTMGANASATVSLTLSMSNALVNFVTNLIIVTNVVNVAASALSDPIPFNNSVATQLIVAPRDSDHDGIPDWWALAHGLNPNDPSNALLDSDGDGISNLQEYLNGTDPFVFDGMAITGWKIASTTNCELTVHAAVGMTYALEASANLFQWSVVSNFLAQSTNQHLQVPFSTSTLTAYYRVSTTTNLPTPILTLLNPTMIGTNAPLLQVAAPPGYSYTVYVSTNLVDWTVLTNLWATTWNTQITDSSTNRNAVHFYRAGTP